MINASKPTRVLNRLAGSGAMLAWYQDKPVGVLNRPAGSGAISSKRDLFNASLCKWFVKKKEREQKHMFRPITYNVIREWL